MGQLSYTQNIKKIKIKLFHAKFFGQTRPQKVFFSLLNSELSWTSIKEFQIYRFLTNFSLVDSRSVWRAKTCKNIFLR